MIRRERWKRNIADSHNPNTSYDREKFGTKRQEPRQTYPPQCTDVTKPSHLLDGLLGYRNIPSLLDPFYTADQLRTVHAIANRKKVIKKDFNQSQKIFTPQILVYMIFMSDDDVLEKYLNYWRKFWHVPLHIPTELITEDLQTGCDCSGCFGACVRIANRYKLLPQVINNEQMAEEKDLKW
jgi:hypothetical protein